jgi:hypothetical protein
MEEIIRETTTPSGFRVVTFFAPILGGEYVTLVYAPDGRVLGASSSTHVKACALRAHRRMVNAY